MAAPKNPLGAKSDKIWRNAIMRAVHRTKSGDDAKALEKLADRLVEEAIGGDVPALREIGDRLDGKAAQPLEHSGDVLEAWLERLGKTGSA